MLCAQSHTRRVLNRPPSGLGNADQISGATPRTNSSECSPTLPRHSAAGSPAPAPGASGSTPRRSSPALIRTASTACPLRRRLTADGAGLRPAISHSWFPCHPTVLTRGQRTTLAPHYFGEPPHALDLARQPEDREQRFLGAQCARLQCLQISGKVCRALEQPEQARLFRDVPPWISGPVVRHDRHSPTVRPRTQTAAGHHSQALHPRPPHHLQAVVFVGLFLAPDLLRFLFDHRASA